MNKLHHALIGSCLALAAIGAHAQDTMKKEPMKTPTMDECKQYMSQKEKNGEVVDPTMKKMDQTCTAMMKKDKDSMKK
jgi:hypothetical protein